MLSLKNKVTLVTGGSSGIGRASALALAKSGAIVVVADIDIPGGENTVHDINDLGGEAKFLKANVAVGTEVEWLIQQIIHIYGRLDCAHNNAGIGGEIARLADCTEDNWDNVILTNLKSIWLCMKYEILQMSKQQSGVIVNTSSVYGIVGCERGMPAYVASKHAILGLTKTAALEYARSGIRVNAICPGAIDTPFREKLIGADCTGESNTSRYPIGRIGQPDEVGGAVVWLCSDEASYVTGSLIVIDGGLTAK
ncbi:MAG: short chain dehydrogenase [Planctomycetes bacterium RBG_16_55_9]|nr:MAG: short chain dehydrogenase [Planctomycetes bacterium RBG_16_55_9]